MSWDDIDWTEIECNSCKERFMCDQVKYDCARFDPPLKGSKDELTAEQRKHWENLCNSHNTISPSRAREVLA